MIAPAGPTPYPVPRPAPHLLAIWPVRREALPLAVFLGERLGGAVQRPWEGGEGARQQDAFAGAFRSAAQWIFIGAAGIAARFLSGLPVSKHRDPAVVVLDDAARFAVALLGGHEGGANRLAYRVALETGAVPVVTTASEATRPLTLGVGCRRGVDAGRSEAATRLVRAGRGLSELREVATVDLKADEPGLLTFCDLHGLPLRVFTRDQLRERPSAGAASDWVQRQVGLPGVCEASALLASPRGRLMASKTALDGVAVALVEDHREWEA